jgi:TrpR-related protein YerC/YecD
MKNNSSIWKSVLASDFASALLSIDDPKLMKAFLRDIMTEKEITELSNRFKAAKMLIDSEKYTNVALVTGLSSRTIARISDWIKQGNGGYQTVIRNLRSHHTHILPAHD